MKLRCIIIDDEYLARQRLLKLLAHFENIVVVAECRNGKEALDKVHLKEPDLIFLDVQMPDMDGFTVYNKLKPKPHVIFTTAYDTYALKAFEINAVDYLLKPFDEERLGIAIDRIAEIKHNNKASSLELKIKTLIQSYAGEHTPFLHKISINEKGRAITILFEDVLCFISDGNYVQIVTDHKTYLHRMTMNALFKSLNPNQYIRIHRSYVLKRTYIENCTYIGNNEFKFKLKNGSELISSRSYKPSVLEYLDDMKH